MEIGHSRLLKFFVKDKPKMEKHTLKIEDLSPSDIESEVPRQQKLRDDTEPIFDENKTELNKIESTRNEGQIEWVDLRDMIKKPIYMGLQEEVIRTQHIRPPRAGDEPPTDKTEKPAPDDIKPQTRIPVSRFKPLAERVLKERRDATNTDKQKSKREVNKVPEKPRRTSIPKLKDRILVAKKNLPIDAGQPESHPIKESKDKIPTKTNLKRATRNDKIPVMNKDHYKITKKDDRVKKDKQVEKEDTSEDQPSAINLRDEPVKTESIEKLDDEFDKLYEEIGDTDAVSLPDDVLDTKVKDPEKLESKFEEIVHQYDDLPIDHVKIEPIDKARYSKIPLLRRRSTHDVNSPRQFERRLSLKTGPLNKSTPLSDQKENDSYVKKKDYEKENNVTGDLENDYVETDSEKAQGNSVIEINNNDEINEDPYIELLSPNPLLDYNTIATPDSELVKVGIFGISTKDIPLEETKQNVATPELETVKVAAIVIPAEESTNRINESIEFEENHDRLPKLQDDTYKSPVDELEIEHKPMAGINLPGQEETKDIIETEKYISNKTTLKGEPIVHNQINHINVPQQNIFINNPDNELKSYNLIKNTNNIEERTKSRYINRPPKDQAKPNNESKIEEDDIPIVKGKVSRILKRLTSPEIPNNFVSNNIIDKEVVDVKKQMDDIPKKKSVLSKIAMFERGDAEPPLPKKTTYKYSKPIRTISEDLKHSPKIVQEVLKPKDVDTDKHTIVTIDILNPVEIITNNEEQVPVVENLKEDTVIYENFDSARQNKIETDLKNLLIQDVLPPKGVHTDKHTMVAVDILKPVEVMNNEEQVTFIENMKESIVTYDNFDQDRLNKIESIEFESENLNNENLLTNNNTNFNNQTNYGKLDDKYLEANADYDYKQENKTKEKWKSTDALAEFLPVKEKINRLKSYECTNLKKAKSTAELDLGDAVKGKVKKMIVRMNSSELLDDVKPKEVEVINAKERPRKRSVSEKIALFERKLTPVTMDNVKVESSARSLNLHAPHTKPVQENVNAIPSVKDNAVNLTNDVAKIKELKSAKLTFGTVSNMSYIQLRDGRQMPVLALGTALLDPNLATHIVAAAIDLGYRAIDTAYIYGNEKEVGEGILAKIQDGTVRREDLFIMNKMWSTFHRPDLVEVACRASLAATGLEYFDLYMIHNPMSFKEGGDPLPKIANVLQFSEFDYLDAWFAMEQLVSKGLVRSIGVSNFNSVQLTRVLEKGRIKPVVNQVECHPYLSQQRLSDFCDARDVRLSCFGVLGSKGTPADLKSSQVAAIDDPLVQVMAAGLGISPAQLLIRYQIDSGHAVAVKASSAAHLWNNLQALNVTLDAPQVAAIHALNKNKRTFTFGGMGDTHKNYPFKIAF